MPKTRTLIIVHLVEKFLPGLIFEKTRADWPLHITLLPWFDMPEALVDDFLEELQFFAASEKPFISIVGKEASFSSSGDKDVPVNIMQQQERYQILHQKLYEIVGLYGGVLRSDHRLFIGKDYTAHITHHHKDGVIHRRHASDRFGFDELTVVEWKAPKTCKVLKTMHFQGEEL